MIGEAKIGAVIRKVYPMNLSARELKLLITIMMTTDSFGVCDLSNAVLAKKNDSSERSITETLSKLAERGILSIVFNRHKHKRLIYVRNFVNNSVKFKEEPPLEHMSPEQRMFKEAFPNKVVDCEVPDNVDMKKLIQEISASKFLMFQAKNMTLYSYCIRYYKLIMSGYYTDSEFIHDEKGNIVKRKSFETEREYTRAEMNRLFSNISQDLEDIQV